MDMFKLRASRGSTTSDFLAFFGAFGLSFALATYLMVARASPGASASLDDLLRLPLALAWELSLASGSRSPARPETYTVERGDTLSGIALAHELDLSELVARNEIADPDSLRVGQVLVIRENGGAPRGVATALRSSATELIQVAALVTRAERQLAAARFDAALGTADAAERLLASRRDSREIRASRARVEVVRATAQMAFGDSQAARRSFQRALEHDPEIRLDGARTSPKVLRVFRESQRGP